MHWITPSEKEVPTGTLGKRRWDTTDQFVPKRDVKPRYSSMLLVGLRCLCLGALLLAHIPAQAEDGLARQQWTVDGVAREALVYVPSAARTNPTPVVFAFHGHGGSMLNAARTFSVHTRWPEAIVVYPQGLNTPGRLTDPDGRRPGWQKEVRSEEH